MNIWTWIRPEFTLVLPSWATVKPSLARVRLSLTLVKRSVYRPAIYQTQGVPPDVVPIVAVRQTLVANGGKDLEDYGVAYSFNSWRLLYQARTRMKSFFGAGNVNCAFYRSAGSTRGGPAEPHTIDSFVINAIEDGRAEIVPFKFFEF